MSGLRSVTIGTVTYLKLKLFSNIIGLQYTDKNENALKIWRC